MAKISGRNKGLADWLAKLGVDINTTRRVVIDIPTDGVVVIYTERYSTTDMIIALSRRPN